MIRVGDTVRVREEAAPGWTKASRRIFSESHRMVVAYHPSVRGYELSGLPGMYMADWLIPVEGERGSP